MQPPPSEGADWWYKDDGQDTQCVPYPGSVLAISGNRGLSMSGAILTEADTEWNWAEPVSVTRRTRAYWEDRAIKAGFTLDELLGE